MARKSFLAPVLLALGFIWTFVAGALVSWFILYRTELVIKDDPSIPIIKTTREEYDILFVSQNEPRKLLFIDYYKAGKLIYGTAHYYDGTSWKQGPIESETITVVPINSSTNQATYKITGTVTINSAQIAFSIPQVYTHMTIRAREEFSKFGGTTEAPSAVLTVGEKSFYGYAALLVGYNSTKELVDWQSLGVKTDWLLFFDKDWNFYHLDNTVVDVFSALYESHSFFAKASESGKVAYFPNFSLSRFQDKLSINYNRLDKLNIYITDTFARKDYGNVSYGALTLDKNGGVGVYLNIDTHQ